MGYISISTSLAIILAPLLGGIVYARSGYYSVFAMAFGLIAMDVFLRLVVIEKRVAKQWTSTLQRREISVSANQASDVFQQCPTVPRPDDTDDNEMGQLGLDLRPPTREAAETSSHGAHLSILLLLRSPRFLATLWGILVQALLLTAFDTVSTIHPSINMRGL